MTNTFSSSRHSIDTWNLSPTQGVWRYDNAVTSPDYEAFKRAVERAKIEKRREDEHIKRQRDLLMEIQDLRRLQQSSPDMLADAIMARIERDGAVHKSSIIDEIERGGLK